MKALKIIGIILGSIVALFLLIALVLPSEYSVERSIIINKPLAQVYTYTSNLKNYNSWQPWKKYDKNAKYELSGEGCTVGSKVSWIGNDQVGQGEMTTIEMKTNKSWKSKVQFFTPYESKLDIEFKFENVEMGTKVTWITKGELSYPLLRWMGLSFESMMAPDFERGLMKLKEVIESGKGGDTDDYQIIITEIDEQKLYVIPDSLSDMTLIPTKLGLAYSELGEFIAKNKIEMIAPPVAITTKYNDKKPFYAFEAGFPVKDNKKIKPIGRIKIQTIPAGTVVKGIHLGPYENVAKVYIAIEKFIKDNDLDIIGYPWEVYFNDPMKVKPEEIETHIFFPVKSKI